MDTRVLALVAHRQVALARRHVVDDGAVAAAAALRRARALGRVTVVASPQVVAVARLETRNITGVTSSIGLFDELISHLFCQNNDSCAAKSRLAATCEF